MISSRLTIPTMGRSHLLPVYDLLFIHVIKDGMNPHMLVNIKGFFKIFLFQKPSYPPQRRQDPLHEENQEHDQGLLHKLDNDYGCPY